MRTEHVSTHAVKDEANRGIVLAARVGYAARGLVYSVLGVLAVMFVLGEGGKLTDNKGALERIHALPFGDALLWITAAGLACYALWCAICAAMDPWQQHPTKKRLGKRIGFALGCVWHASLALYAGQLAYGASHSEEDTQNYVAEALQLPFGNGLAGIVGAITIVVGLRQIYRAIANESEDELEASSLSEQKRRVICRLARFGRAARGSVFPIIGASLIVAAWRQRPGEARGYGDALKELASQPFGGVLTGIVALGLLAFGVYQLSISWFGRVPESS